MGPVDFVMHGLQGRFVCGVDSMSGRQHRFRVIRDGRWTVDRQAPAGIEAAVASLAKVRAAREQGLQVLVLPWEVAYRGEAVAALFRPAGPSTWTTFHPSAPVTARAEALRGVRVVLAVVGEGPTVEDLYNYRRLTQAGVVLDAVLVARPPKAGADWTERLLSGDDEAILAAVEHTAATAMGVERHHPLGVSVDMSSDWHTVEHLVPPGICLLYGAPSSGKSTVAAGLVGAVVTGTTWAGRHVMPGPALVVCGEDREGMHLRISTWLLANDATRDFACVVEAASASGGADGVSALFEQIARAVDVLDPRLLVLDTLTSLVPGLNENDPAAMSGLVSRLRKLLVNREGMTVLVLHHPAKTGKSDAPRGHGSLVAAADASIEVVKRNEVTTLRVRKARNFPGGVASFSLVQRRGFVVADELAIAQPREAATRSGSHERILTVLHDAESPLSAATIVKDTSLGRSTVHMALRALQEQGRVSSNGGKYTAVEAPTDSALS